MSAPPAAMVTPTDTVSAAAVPRTCGRPRAAAGISTSGTVAVAKKAAPPMVDSTPNSAAAGGARTRLAATRSIVWRTASPTKAAPAERTAAGLNAARPAVHDEASRATGPGPVPMAANATYPPSTVPAAAPTTPNAAPSAVPNTRRTAGSSSRLAVTRRCSSRP